MSDSDVEEPRRVMQRGRRRRGVRDNAFDREGLGEIPTDGIAWHSAPHHLTTTRLLTVDDPRAENPPGFKGELFPPQKTFLAATLALENFPALKILNHELDFAWEPLLQTKVLIIKAVLSFGKTVLALAHICAQRVPMRLPEQLPMSTYPLRTFKNLNRADIRAGNYDPVGIGFLPECTVRYSRFLPLTVVAAASSVISQWEENITRFTDLRYFIIENVRSLRTFNTMYRAGEVANLDLLLVKAGRVTTSFKLPGEPPRLGKSKNRSLFEALARILEGVTVARHIIDDYDTLKLGRDDCFLPAMFTWLISATRRQTNTSNPVQCGQRTVEEFFRDNLPTKSPIMCASQDDILNNAFSINCDPSYVDEYINSCEVGFRRIFVRGGHAAAILRDLEVPAEVIEMINADAPGAAAQALGIAAGSVADIVRRVVGNHIDKLRQAVRAIARVESVSEELQELPPGETTPATIRELRTAIKSGTDGEVKLAVSVVNCYNQRVRTALTSIREWAEEQKVKHGITLNRMRDNIREGCCQCCTIPFNEDDDEEAEAAYILAGCCQIIVCEPCITRTNLRIKSFLTRCPNCAQDINVATDLVRVGAELDLEAALNDESVAEPESVETEPVGEAESVGEAELKRGPEDEPYRGPEAAAIVEEVERYHAMLNELGNPKLKALIQLLRDDEIECIRDVATAPFIDRLLSGRKNILWPDDKPRKYFIFTMHPESTNLIAETLERFEIGFSILRGSRAQKDEALRRFRTEVSVCLATAARDCAGVHAPYISHTIFYHRVVDKNIEYQVAGRGQRVGREYNHQVTSLINEAEAEDL